MTADIITPEQAQQAALLAELRLMQERMARHEEELERERAELATERAQLAAGGVPADSIAAAVAEVRREHEHDDPNNRMNRPCQHVKDGAICGLPWRTNGEISHPKTHSYRAEPLKTTDAPKGRMYVPTKADMARYGLPEPVSAAELYVDEKGAAELLGATLPQVRKMVKNQTLKADQIGKVTLIHRESVMRIVAVKETLAGEGEA